MLFNYSNDNLLDKYKENTNNEENMEKMIYNIISSIIFILAGIVLIIHSLTYKYSAPFRDQNFSGWLMGFFCIFGGIYLILKAIFER